MSLTAVTVLKSGGVFSPIWCDRLVRQIKEHIRPDRIVCLTDMDVKSCEVIPLKHGWPGWHSKLELFRPGLFDGTVVYLDLDTLVLKESPLKGFVHVSGGYDCLLMLNDFYRPERPASGMMIWGFDCSREIYEDFANNPKCEKGFSKGDGAIIGRYPHRRIQNYFGDTLGVASYKAHKLQDGPKGYSICCFHGEPKQNTLPANSWARREWEKPTE